MAFPGPGAQVYYNEAGEPLGWDYPSTEPPEPDEYFQSRLDAAAEQWWEEEYDAGVSAAEAGDDLPDNAEDPFREGYRSIIPEDDDDL